MARPDDERAARLLERLLTDPVIRAAFRRDPAGVAREAQLPGLADDFAVGKAMETLEARESRSSLAGVMMAAAVEGFAGLGLAREAAASGHGVPPAVDRVLAKQPSAAASPPPPEPSGAADLATPEGAASEQAAAAPDAAWTGGPNHAGVHQVVEHNASQAASDAGADDDGGDENEPDENEGWDAADENSEGAGHDALDEATHDHDSSGDSGDVPARGAPSGDVPAAGAPSGDAPSGGDNADDGGPLSTDDLGGPVDEMPSGAGAADGYPGDDASHSDLAAWMGAEAKRRGLPAELPVMAALTESGMANLDHGDRDSVGFFQMRQGTWDKGEYAGYAGDAKLQLRWFLDKALEVKQQRLAQGGSVTDPSQYGAWIADVERPAEQLRGRYQEHLDDARSLLDQGGSGERTAPSAGELLDAAAPGPALQPATTAVAAVAEAQKYVGTPYKWGGSSPSTGFDCSGLVQWAYAKVGVRIPRTTDTQFDAPNGAAVKRDALVRGDVVYFRDPTGYVHHEGLYLGDGKFLHAPHTGDVVKVSSLDEPYYKEQFAGGRRFVKGEAAADQVEGKAVAARSSSAAPSEPAVRAAMKAAERDAAEARRPGTLLFQAVRRQEDAKQAEEARLAAADGA